MVKILVLPTNLVLSSPTNKSLNSEGAALDNGILASIQVSIRKHYQHHPMIHPGGLLYYDRSYAETDTEYLQVIPYIVLTNKDSVFVYTRLKKGGESRLHLNRSIGIGGHIDYNPSDVYHNAKIEDVILTSAYRELFEELNIESNSNLLELVNKNVLIYDSSNDVGKVHLGVLYTCDVTDRVVSVKETHKLNGMFYTFEELKKLFADEPDSFENWSKIAFKTLFGA